MLPGKVIVGTAQPPRLLPESAKGGTILVSDGMLHASLSIYIALEVTIPCGHYNTASQDYCIFSQACLNSYIPKLLRPNQIYSDIKVH